MEGVYEKCFVLIFNNTTCNLTGQANHLTDVGLLFLFIRRIPHFFTFQKYGRCVFTFHGKTNAQFTMKLVFSEKVMYFENKMVVVQNLF